MLSHFSHVPLAPSDPIFGLNIEFQKDKRKEKVDLSAGVYRTSSLETPILSCVKEAEKFLLESQTNKKYLPIEGEALYLEESAILLLGKDLYSSYKDSLSLIQSIGGSGALRLGGEFIKKYGSKVVYIPDPSWMNHRAIFSECGLEVLSYPYYDFNKKDVHFSSMMDFLFSLPPKSVVLFHVSCHNPSGADLTQDQWALLADLCIEKELIPFFDAAYIGFAGTFEEDSFPIKLFIQKKIEFLMSFSFSKNFSLYGERVGFFLFFTDPTRTPFILSQLKVLVRRNYSNPPMHGVKIVTEILKTESLRALWEEELLQMKERIREMRELFVEKLSSENKGKDYSYMLSKNGLFSFCDITKEQVDSLILDYGVYLPSDGRVNLAGLRKENISYVVNSLIMVGG